MIFAAVLVAPLAGSAFQEPDALPRADPAITQSELSHHVGFLASDELRGRRAGTAEADRAALYLARALEAAGLAPGGDEGTFLQAIPSTRVVQRSAPKMVFVAKDGSKEEGIYGVDFNVIFRGAARSTPELPILFVHTEQDLPEEPDPSQALFFRGTSQLRAEWFAWRGMGDGEGFGLDVLAASSEVGAFEQGRSKKPPAPSLEIGAPGPEGCERVTLRGRVRERMLREEYERVALLCDEERTPSREYNVVGILRGKSDEAIVLFASYDHKGVSQGRRGEREGPVRYGANDASACAALLELAQTLAQGPELARTVVFLLPTGGSKARFGTRHYLAHPALPLERTSLVLDVEALGLPLSARDRGQVFVTGGERSSVGPALERAGLLADPDREAHLYQRHESYDFALEGIVAHSVWSTPSAELKPAEDRAEKLDYEHVERATRALFEAIRCVADDPERPAWTARGRPFDPADYGKDSEEESEDE